MLINYKTLFAFITVNRIFSLYFILIDEIDLPMYLTLVNPFFALFQSYILRKLGMSTWKSYEVLIIDIVLPFYGVLAFYFFLLNRMVLKNFYKKEAIDVYRLPLGNEDFDLFSYNKEVLIEGENLKYDQREMFDFLKIQPYIDIINGDQIPLKLSAIEKLSGIITKKSLEILHHALDNESYEVRYFAHQSLEKIEKRLLSKIDDLSENIQLFPQNDQNYYERASCYLELVELGLATGLNASFFLKKSLEDLLFSLALSSKNIEIHLLICKVYLKMGKYKKVIDSVQRTLRHELNDYQRQQALFYQANAHFELKQFVPMFEIFNQLKNFSGISADFQQIYQWWNLDARTTQNSG